MIQCKLPVSPPEVCELYQYPVVRTITGTAARLHSLPSCSQCLLNTNIIFIKALHLDVLICRVSLTLVSNAGHKLNLKAHKAPGSDGEITTMTLKGFVFI